MGLKIFKTKRTANGQEQMRDVTDVVCDAVTDAALEFQIRELCFWTCVNFVANAIGRCEVKTYVERTEARGREYYMWNVEPNTNQSSSAFWHKAIAKLFEENEALIIPTRKRDGFDAVVAASPSVWYPGWTAYAQTHRFQARAAYLSLGDKEAKTRNPLMRAVDTALLMQRGALDAQNIPNELEWNPGNHFVDAALRTAKGHAAMIRTLRSMPAHS